MKKITINIIFAILMVMVWQVTSAFAGATFTVNDSSTGNTCNNSLSLYEAARIAESSASPRFSGRLTAGEKAQVTGAVFIPVIDPPDEGCPGAIWEMVNGGGRLFADDIKFTNDVGIINGGIILGKNDDIDGLKPNGQKVILNGSGIVGNVNGIKLLDTDPTGSQVRNLVIQNFPLNGVLAAHLNGAIFEGLDIHGNGGNGLVLTYPIGGTANSRNVTVGGDQPQHRNLIYGNTLNGIEINALSNSDHNGSQNIVVKNNYIGTSDGTSDNGNNGNGIVLDQAFGVTIGDTTGATRNVISGNNNDGIQIKGSGATGNTIIGNFIGTDTSSGVRLGNGSSGIGLVQGAGDNADIVNIPANKIGLPGLGNVISGNNFGIYVADANTSNNWIQANYIGTNVGGTTDLGNTADGILLGFGTFDNRVGDTGTGEGNLIAFNRNGVLADGGIRNFIKRNRMFSNDNLGIDLSPPSGVNPNDAGDGDTGPNNLQNYPVITYVNAQNNSVTIQGTFNSAGNLTYTLEFFGNTAADSTGFGEGRNYIGSTTVTTNASGNATFNVPFSVSLATVGTWITATATDSSNNTSEFSQARSICADLSLSPSATTMSNAGGAGNFTVVNSVGCSYTAQSNAAWITVGSISMGTVNFTVAANSGIQRSGTITISYNNGTTTSSRTFTVNQTNGCTFSLSPTSMNIAAAGGTNSFNIIASDASCTWTITPNASWLSTILQNGTGNSPVFFTVLPNTGPARSGTITAAGQTFTVNQSGVGCTYSLSPTNQSVTAAGTSLSFSLITTAGCTWTAVSNAAWITVIGGANGTGNGTISYTVAANTGPARSGTITAGGQLFTINQASGCSFTLNPTSQSFSTAGGNGSFNVIASNGACTWTATESATWITITGGGSGTGNGTVSFSVDANAGVSRAAFIVVGGQSFTVSQANGCTFSVSPISLNIAAAGGNSSFNVTTSDSSCGWTALSNSSWITGVAGGFQFGNQTITFAVAANTGAARTGTITVAGQTFTVNQASGCVYSISPSFQSVPGIGGTISFAVTTTAGCSWSASVNNTTWITITSGSSGSGNGTINITVAPNPGNARAGSINISFGDGFVGVSQASQCTYVTNPTSATFPTSGGSGSFTVTNATGCNWNVNRGLNSWITITSSSNNSGNQTVTYTVAPNTGAARNGNIGIFENITGNPNRTFTITQAGKQTKFDFDGDNKTDIGIFRPTGGEWWYLRSSDGQNRAFPFGLATDKLVPADYTGDGKNDVAFWRPSTGFWYVMRSEDNTFYAFPFGTNGDIPAPGDYDGDGVADVAVFRPSNRTWFINKSSGGTTIQQFGAAGDLPIATDYDGDGKTDIAIFRPNGTNGAEWWILRSSNGSVFATQFGLSTDKAVPADFTGDGKADIAFWRPSNGFWYVLRSEDFSYYAAPFGANGDVPTVGDYDGDGKSDFAVFRPSNNTWFIQRSTAGTLIQGFGNVGDVPIPSVFTP